jgi:hypothetical protein
VPTEIPAPADLRSRLAAYYRAGDEQDRRHFESRCQSIRHFSCAWWAHELEQGRAIHRNRWCLAEYLPDLPAGVEWFLIDEGGRVWTTDLPMYSPHEGRAPLLHSSPLDPDEIVESSR